MKILLVTDAWLPQVNGVVTTLVQLVSELERVGNVVEVIHPGLFKTRPCPGYPGIALALHPGKALEDRVQAARPDTIHLATEGPLGWAMRSYCRKHNLAFTSGYHSRLPDILKDRFRLPLWAGYGLLRRFHAASSGVMVPTSSVLRALHDKGFRRLRSWTHGVDTNALAYQESPQVYPPLGALARPVSLYVGRLDREKNIEEFLKLDVPGTKVVCGTGPLQRDLQGRYPTVRWIGVLPREELARVYAAADVFVMPSHSDTFGLAMLEAMACGTPVAAYPVDGAREVLGTPAQGGVTDEDLSSAWYAALAVPRFEARKRATQFQWAYASLLFAGHLVPAHAGVRISKKLLGFSEAGSMPSDA